MSESYSNISPITSGSYQPYLRGLVLNGIATQARSECYTELAGSGYLNNYTKTKFQVGSDIYMGNTTSPSGY